jgi:aminomethyltransferase
LVAIRLVEKGPPLRSHYTVFADGQPVGTLSSGGISPSLGFSIGMAFLPATHTAVGTKLEIDVRGKHHAAVVVKKPFYHKTV